MLYLVVALIVFIGLVFNSIALGRIKNNINLTDSQIKNYSLFVWGVPFLGAIFIIGHMPAYEPEEKGGGENFLLTTSNLEEQFSHEFGVSFSEVVTASNSDNIDLEKYKRYFPYWFRHWIASLGDHVGADFSAYELTHSVVLSQSPFSFAKAVDTAVGYNLSRMRQLLAGIDCFNEDKCAVFIFDDEELYYSYLGQFYDEDGEFSQSSGVFISLPFKHLVVKSVVLSEIEHVPGSAIRRQGEMLPRQGAA